MRSVREALNIPGSGTSSVLWHHRLGHIGKSDGKGVPTCASSIREFPVRADYALVKILQLAHKEEQGKTEAHMFLL